MGKKLVSVAVDADAIVTVSSGNVFTDLGFGPGEAAVMALRADWMARLRLMVKTEGWTQAQAAERFGIAQSRVSHLLRGTSRYKNRIALADRLCIELKTLHLAAKLGRQASTCRASISRGCVMMPSRQ